MTVPATTPIHAPYGTNSSEHLNNLEGVASFAADLAATVASVLGGYVMLPPKPPEATQVMPERPPYFETADRNVRGIMDNLRVVRDYIDALAK